jgi:putative transposase
VTQRGNDRQPVFLCLDDRRLYLELLGRYAVRHGTRLLGYCLMSNHVHLVAVPERADSLALTLGRAHSEYALAFNRAHGHCGHVWQNRFFSCLLDEAHLLCALRYVESNPVRAGMAAEPWGWPWSSARAHTEKHALDPVLDCHWEEYLGQWNFEEWREILAAGMEGGACDAVRRATYAGEPLGGEEFLRLLERQAGRRLRVLPRGRPRKESAACERPLRQQSLFAGAV